MAPDSSPMPPAVRATAIRVLETEAAALGRLAAGLDSTFEAAILALFALKGRAVVTGMGKSGHVARKIAATLASTGTPALFVHPSEASHGDLGMITPEDAVVALSNSGETAELRDIVAYTRRFAIPLIAITSRAASALGQAADHLLLLPEAPEACPMGLAPTTSTTMMLALGDAMAIALLERRGFTAEAFRAFHPGGKLGRLLVRVADLMHGADSLPLIRSGGRMDEAMVTMSRCGFGCVGVLDDQGRLMGIVTDGDLRRHMAPDLMAQPVARVMTARPQTIAAGALAAEALQRMNGRGITSLFVVAREDPAAQPPVGLIHIHDCLRAGVM